MEIRKFTADDRQGLIRLWGQAFPDDLPHNAPAAMLDAKRQVDDLIFVAADGDTIVGACMAGYDGHRGWLYAVAVAREVRRRGTGGQLVRAAVAALEARGCVKVNLQVRATNHAVAAFYESLGFATEERISMGKLLV